MRSNSSNNAFKLFVDIFSCNIWSFTHLFVTLQAEPKNKLILDIKKGS